MAKETFERSPAQSAYTKARALLEENGIDPREFAYQETRKPVGVIGMGLVTPVGNSVDESWANLNAGYNGVGYYSDPEMPNIKTKIAARIKNFDPEERLQHYIDPADIDLLSPSIYFPMVAAGEALTQAGLLSPYEKDIWGEMQTFYTLNTELINPEDFANLGATGVGGSIDETGVAMRRVMAGKKPDPGMVFRALPGRIHGATSQAFNLQGVGFGVLGECASGAMNLGEAMWLLRNGRAKVAMAVASESAMGGIGVGMFELAGALSRGDDPNKSPKAFDKLNDGFGYGEGGAALIIADLDYARMKGIPVLAELAGYGNTNDAYHPSNPHPEGRGGSRALRIALEEAGGFSKEGLVYFNAHATGTPGDADRIEARVIAGAMNGNEDKMAGVSGTKPSTGHGLGSASLMEAIFTIQALRTGVLPPTIKSEQPIEEALQLKLVQNEARYEPNVVMGVKTGFGFEGHNAALVFKRV